MSDDILSRARYGEAEDAYSKAQFVVGMWSDSFLHCA